MYPVIKNVMLASADQVAIDAVAAKMMGFDPLSIHYIALAHEDGWAWATRGRSRSWATSMPPRRTGGSRSERILCASAEAT